MQENTAHVLAEVLLDHANALLGRCEREQRFPTTAEWAALDALLTEIDGRLVLAQTGEDWPDAARCSFD